MADNVEKIISKIMEDANKKSQEIKETSEKQAEEKLESARKRGEASREKINKEADRAADQTRKKIIAEATIKARTVILESKDKLIQAAFTNAETELESLMSSKNYSKVIRDMAVDTCIEMGGGEIEITTRKEDEKTLAKELKNIEKEVEKATEKATRIKLSTDEISPGIIARGMGGEVEINSTFNNRLELLRSELRLKVAEVLFS